MRTILATIFLAFLGMQSQAQDVQNSPVTIKRLHTDIADFMLTVKKEKHREWLKEFAKDRDSSTQMSVHRETRRFYEIWVNYNTSDGYAWGEGYRLNKRNGKIEMIWHEQPIKREPLQLDSIPPKKAEKHN